MSSYDDMCTQEDGGLDGLDGGLDEFISFYPPADTNWSREATLKFIEFYRVYRPQLGTPKLRRKHELWQLLAREMTRATRKTYSAAQCENKWTVLERGYRKVIDNNKSTGRGRKTFEFQKELDAFLGRNANINPPLLLAGHVASQAVATEDVSERPQVSSQPGTSYVPVAASEVEPPSEPASSNDSSKVPGSPSLLSKKFKAKKRASQEELDERREYQKARLQIDKQRLEGRERREEKNMEVQTRIMHALEESNAKQQKIIELMAEHNELLKKYIVFRMFGNQDI